MENQVWRSVADKIIPIVKHVENIILKSKLVKYIECNEKI